MVDFRDFVAAVGVISVLAGMLGAIGAGALAVARLARAGGRRPWVWILVAYAASNVVWGILGAVLGAAR